MSCRNYTAILRSITMRTLVDGVNHIAVLTADMERFIRFYQEAFDAKVEHDERNHAGHTGERMMIMSIGERSELNVFEVPGNTQARVQTPILGAGASIILVSMPAAERRSNTSAFA